MLSKGVRNTFIITLIILIAGSTVAFAHGRGDYRGDRKGYDCDGYGYHQGRDAMGYGPGPGHHMGRGGMQYGPGDRSYGRGYGADLSDEELAKIDTARDKFFKETDALRKQIRDKRIALRDEITAENPNAEKAASLQKELSQLESEFDQIAVQHRLEMRKLLPDDVKQGGFGRWGGRAFGSGDCRR